MWIGHFSQLKLDLVFNAIGLALGASGKRYAHHFI